MRLRKNLNFNRILRENLAHRFNNPANDEGSIAEPTENTINENSFQTQQIDHAESFDFLPQNVPDVNVNNGQDNNIRYVQNSLSLERPDHFSSLISSFIFRHNLSKECCKDFLKMFEIYKKIDMPEFKFNPSNYSSFLTEFSFCDCFKIIDTKNLCTVCNSRGKHFLTVNNFLEESCRICKEYFKITSKEFNCEFSIYTDGISPFKKSDICLWPIYIVFNKIPYKHRYELGNFCILGIYFGRVKPNMQKILELSFKKELKSLNSSFLHENINFTFNLKFLICDKPAKSLVLNFQSSNAHYFCPVCVSTSKTQQINGTKHTFIPIENFFNAEKRTEANFISLAYSAAENHVAEFGIKGFCFLTNIKSFSITGSCKNSNMNSHLKDYNFIILAKRRANVIRTEE